MLSLPKVVCLMLLVPPVPRSSDAAQAGPETSAQNETIGGQSDHTMAGPADPMKSKCRESKVITIS